MYDHLLNVLCPVSPKILPVCLLEVMVEPEGLIRFRTKLHKFAADQILHDLGYDLHHERIFRFGKAIYG